MKIEHHNLHGTGAEECEVYEMPGEGWAAVTSVPCPVAGCDQTVIWFEAGYVPGYRVCADIACTDKNHYSLRSVRHRFQADFRGNGEAVLIRDTLMEEE